jgi:hypothetical protein
MTDERLTELERLATGPVIDPAGFWPRVRRGLGEAVGEIRRLRAEVAAERERFLSLIDAKAKECWADVEDEAAAAFEKFAKAVREG